MEVGPNSGYNLIHALIQCRRLSLYQERNETTHQSNGLAMRWIFQRNGGNRRRAQSSGDIGVCKTISPSMNILLPSCMFLSTHHMAAKLNMSGWPAEALFIREGGTSIMFGSDPYCRGGSPFSTVRPSALNSGFSHQGRTISCSKAAFPNSRVAS